MAPAHTPPPIVDLLNRTITAILQRPDIEAAWKKQGATPLVMSQQEFQSFMAAEVVKWAKVINDNHIATIK
jgi:tripartite-type tricarboxylate transporter receptor subunit TctC